MNAEKYYCKKKDMSCWRIELDIYDSSDNIVSTVFFGYPYNAYRTPQKFVKNASRYSMFQLHKIESNGIEDSKALELASQWIQENRKDIKWLLGYSDFKKNDAGKIYQENSWKYFGFEEVNGYYKLDGEIIDADSMLQTYNKNQRIHSSLKEYLEKNFSSVEKLILKKHAYIKTLQEVEMNLEEKEYPINLAG